MQPDAQASEYRHPGKGIMLVLAYLPPFAVIPLLLEKDDPEVHWHAKHGIVLMAAEMLVLLALVVFSVVLGLMTALLGCLLLPLIAIPWLAFLVVHIVAVVKAFNGRRLIIPLISEYADRF